MSDVRLLSPSLDLIDEVMKELRRELPQGHDKDLSETLAVFPGKRPAAVLRKRIADALQSAYRPPVISSIDLFIDHLYSRIEPVRRPVLSEPDAVAILFELHHAMPVGSRLGGAHFDALETFYPVGVNLFSELEELTIAGVEPQQLRSALSAVTIGSAHAVSSLFVPFYGHVHERGFVTRAQQYRKVADAVSLIDLSRFRKIVLAGFFAFTHSEEKIIRHLLTLPNAVFLFQQGEGIGQTLEQLGLRPETEGEVREPDHFYYESPDVHGQFSALNRVLQERLPEPEEESRRAAIILPSSENLFPLYHQTLSAYDQDSYNLALGYPLMRTPVYGFLMSAAGVIASVRNGEIFVPDYLQFLLHPYTKNILFENRTDVTRMLIHGIEEEFLRHSAKVFRSMETLETDPHLFEGIVRRLQREDIRVTAEALMQHLRQIHDMTVRPFIGVTTVGGLAAACIAVIQFINERSTAHRHPYFRPFVERLLETLDALRRSQLADAPLARHERFAMFLRHCLSAADVPFSGTPLKGLQVLGFLETRGLKFRDVFLIDANDDVLPGTVRQDVLLPLTIREQLGLSTYRDQERIKAYVFDVLRRGAERLHCFFVNNHEKERSRFVAQLQWKEQQRSASLAPVRSMGQTYAIDLGTDAPVPVKKSPEMMEVIRALPLSSSALDEYLTCGVKFYYRFVLRLRERGEVSGDVERSDVGKIVHAILREYYEPVKDRPLTPQDLDPVRLERIADAQFRSAYGSAQFGEQFLTRRQVVRHLQEYLRNVQLPAIGTVPVMITALEQTFEAELDGVRFTGDADRIEQRGDSTVIIDYKTGQNERFYLIRFEDVKEEDRSTWKEAIGSLQLVLYAALYHAVTGTAVESINPAYIFLGKKDLDDKCEVPLFKDPEQARQYYPVLRSVIRTLSAEILNADIPFTATSQPKEDCPECAFATICGTLWAGGSPYS